MNRALITPSYNGPERRQHDPEVEERISEGVNRSAPSGVLRSLGLGLITGAADDDPSAIGTYAAAGATFGPSFLWTAPVTFPMMFAVVYLSSKLGQVAGKGLLAVVREHYPRWLLHTCLIGVLIGNIVEAGADLGGMAAAVNVIVPVPIGWIVAGVTLTIVGLQIWGSYTFIRDIFRWLALALLAYVGPALLAKPDLWPTLKGTVIPHLHFTKEFLAMLVAVIGTTLSAYLYTWQSNQDVEEDTARDVTFGMFFSNIVMYFIILSTASTLFAATNGAIRSWSCRPDPSGVGVPWKWIFELCSKTSTV